MVAFSRAVIVFCNLIYCFVAYSLTFPSSFLKLSSENRHDGSGDRGLVFVYSIIMTTFKTADGEDSILLIFIFYITSPSEKKTHTSSIEKKKNRLG